MWTRCIKILKTPTANPFIYILLILWYMKSKLTWFISTSWISVPRDFPRFFLPLTLTRDFSITTILIQTQEARIILAIKAIRLSKKINRSNITKIYDILYSTLTDRINSRTPIYKYWPGVSKLTELEEEIIIQNILDINTRRFAPRLASIEDIANYILESQGGRYIRKL
jgi:hypothetical protein